MPEPTGDISIRVTPDARDFLTKLRAQVEPPAARLGDDIGRIMGRGISTGVAASIIDGLVKGGSAARAQGKRTAEDFTGQFDRTVRTKIAAALKSLPSGDIKLDDTDAQAKIEQVKAALKLTDASVKIGARDDEAVATIAALKADLDELAAKSPDIRVRVDTAAAAAELLALQTELDLVDKPVKVKVDSSEASKASSDVNKLALGLVAIGPAAIPVAAVGAAAFVALGESAGVALLAVAGIKREMAEGTPVGKQYSAVLGGLKTDVAGLEDIAAKAAFPAVGRTVSGLRADMPQLATDTRLLAGYLADAAGHVVHGLAGGFITLQPAMAFLVREGDRLAADFDRYANGGGLQKFGAWVEQNAPQIGHDLENIGTLVAHLLDAGAGQGVGVLGDISLIAKGLNEIPVGTLKVIVPLVTDTYLAFKGWSLISGWVNSATGSLSKFTGKAQAAAVASATLTAEGDVGAAGGKAGAGGKGGFLAGLAGGATGAAGALSDLAGPLAIATAGYLALSSAATQAAKNPGLTGDIGTALNHVLHPTSGFSLSDPTGVTATAAKGSQGQYDAALLQGPSSFLGNFTSNPKGIAGSKNEVAELDQGLADLVSSGDTKKASQDFQAFTTVAAKQGITFGALTKQLPLYSAAAGKLLSPDQVAAQEAAAAAAAKALGTTVPLAEAAAAAAAQNAAQQKLATVTMQDENDAAGLLDAALSKLGGNSLGVAENQTALLVSNRAVIASFKTNGDTVSSATAKGLSNQQALQGQTQAAISLAEAIGKQTGSSKQEIASLDASKAALEANLRSHGELTASVQAYINKLYDLKNLHIPPTNIDANTSTALAHMRQLTGSYANYEKLAPSVTVSVNTGAANAAVLALKRNLESIPGANLSVSRIAQYQGAEGMIVKAFAGGGIENHAPQMATTTPGAVRVWAEPETKGESYIPHANDHRRPRAHQIMAATAALIGGSYTPFADGGITRSGKSYEYAGILYGSKRSAENAQTRAHTAAAAQKAAALAQTLSQDRQTGILAGNSYLTGLGLSQQVSAPSNLAQTLAAVSAFAKAKGGSAASLAARLRSENTELSRSISDRTAIEARLATAQQKLSDLVSARAQEKASVAGATSASFSIASTGYADTFSIKSALANKVKQALQFDQDLATAEKHGVSQSLITQLAEAGADAGAVSAHTLATASKADVRTIDSLNSKLTSTSAAIGSQVSGELYNTGVNATQSLAKGLESQDKTLAKSASHLADVIVKQIRKSLDMHSPSKKLVALGSETGHSFNTGFAAHVAAVQSTAADMAMAAVPTAAAPSFGVARGAASSFPRNVVLMVGNRPMDAYVDERAASLDASAMDDLAYLHRAGVR